MSRKKSDSRGSGTGRTGSSNLSRRAMLSATAATSAGLVGAVGSAGASHSDYEIRPVLAPDVDKTYTIDAVHSLVNQINNKTGESAKALKTHRTDVSPDPDEGECTYFAQVANDLDIEGKSSQNQMIMVGHQIWEWGFGKSCSYTTWDSNHDIYGGVHCVEGWAIKESIGVNIGIQELGHGEPWYLGHGDGRVDGGSYIRSVSPLATSYTYDYYSNADTHANDGCGRGGSGSGNVPDEFCNGYPNEDATGFMCPVHTDTISSCFESAIDAHGGWY